MTNRRFFGTPYLHTYKSNCQLLVLSWNHTPCLFCHIEFMIDWFAYKSCISYPLNIMIHAVIGKTCIANIDITLFAKIFCVLVNYVGNVVFHYYLGLWRKFLLLRTFFHLAGLFANYVPICQYDTGLT